MLNSTVCLISCYFLLIFTDFLPNSVVRYRSAWVLIAFVALMIAANIGFYIAQNFRLVWRDLKTKYQKLKVYIGRLKKIMVKRNRANKRHEEQIDAFDESS